MNNPTIDQTRAAIRDGEAEVAREMERLRTALPPWNGEPLPHPYSPTDRLILTALAEIADVVGEVAWAVPLSGRREQMAVLRERLIAALGGSAPESP